MHIVGKICAWLVVIAAGAALGLTAKLLDVRGQWLKQANDLKIANVASAEKLAKSRSELTAVQADLSRELIRWERYWNNVPAAFIGDAGNAALQADVGTDQKFGAAEGDTQPAAYVFQLAEDGSPTYVGPFQVTQARQTQSAMRPAFRVRAGETIAANGNWRLRAMIPDANKARFLDLESQLLVADERLLKEQSNLTVQTQLVETAKQHRDFRLAELLGGDKLPEGLMSQLAKAEDDRNAAQAEVDRLRRDVSAAVHHLQELAAKNKELVRQLADREIRLNAETADAGRD